jgi:hypothetical protein
MRRKCTLDSYESGGLNKSKLIGDSVYYAVIQREVNENLLLTLGSIYPNYWN